MKFNHRLTSLQNFLFVSHLLDEISTLEDDFIEFHWTFLTNFELPLKIEYFFLQKLNSLLLFFFLVFKLLSLASIDHD